VASVYLCVLLLTLFAARDNPICLCSEPISNLRIGHQVFRARGVLPSGSGDVSSAAELIPGVPKLARLMLVSSNFVCNHNNCAGPPIKKA